MELRAHQERALALIEAHVRILLHHFCGTGKTEIGLTALTKFRNARDQWHTTVVIVPSLPLVQQWHEQIRGRGYSGELLSICSSSDDSKSAEHPTIQFTTTEAAIVERLVEAKRMCRHLCVTITYQSLWLLEKTFAHTSVDAVPDLVLFDEAHHMDERTVRELLFRTYEEGTAPEWSPFWKGVGRMVFFTASPRNRYGIVMDPELTHDLDTLALDDAALKTLIDDGLVPEYAEPRRRHGDIQTVGHCGFVDRFCHSEAVVAQVCNDFRIAMDFFCVDNVQPKDETTVIEQQRYELCCSIARAVFQTGNARVLTFHKQVVDNDRSPCSVAAMGDPATRALLRRAFETVLQNEFPEKQSMYTDLSETFLRVRTIDASNSNHERAAILRELDETPDTDKTVDRNYITIVASCETIGEGIDTKRCNMAVFVDVIRSFVHIIQRIGRTTRRPASSAPLPPATLLLPVGVLKSDYQGVQDDPDKRDECIRASMQSQRGDFSKILNVIAAVRQTDPALYNDCLFYPCSFSPSEVKKNLARHGFAVVEPELDAANQAALDAADEAGECDDERLTLCTALTHGETTPDDAEAPLADTLLDATDSDDAMQRYADRTGRVVEVHSTSMETPVRRVTPTTEQANASDAADKVLFYNASQQTYQPTQPVTTTNAEPPPTRNSGPRDGPPQRPRRVNVHTHPDVRVLWGLSDDDDNANLDFMARRTQLGFIEATVDMKGAVTKWFETLERLEAWMVENPGERPSNASMDPNEKFLAGWKGDQQKFSHPPLKYIHASNSVVHEAWNEHMVRFKEIYSWNVKVWHDTLAVLEDWLDSHPGKLPNQKAKDENEVSSTHSRGWRPKPGIHSLDILCAQSGTACIEKWLASWIGTQKKNSGPPRKYIHKTYETIHVAWNTHVEKYAELYYSNTDRWYKSLSDLEAWMSSHPGLRPQNNSDDPDEKRLGIWLSNQLYNAAPPRKQIHATNTDVHAKWNKHITQYSELYQSNADVWYETLGQLEEWLVVNPGKRPSKDSRTADAQEKKLGNWVASQLKNAKSPRGQIHATDDAVHSAWTTHVAKFPALYRTTVDTWFETLRQLEEWLTSHSRKRPKDRAPDREGQLASWIRYQLNAAGPPQILIHRNATVHAAWNAHIEQFGEVYYRPSDVEVWFQTLSELESWLVKHPDERPPQKTSLGAWIGTQQKKAGPPRKRIHATSDAVHNAWNAHVLAHASLYSKKVVNAARAATQASTERIDAALAPFGLCSHDVGAAGDCQFRALAHFLLGDAERHAEVRAAVAAELTAHPERYKPFVEEWALEVVDAHRQSYASFVDRMTRQGTWGGNTTLLAAATVYRRTLHLVTAPLSPDTPTYYTAVRPQAADDTTEPDDDREGTTTIWLAYLNGNHYRATRPLDAGSGAIVAEPKVPSGTQHETLKARIQRAKQAAEADAKAKTKAKPRKRKAKAGSKAKGKDKSKGETANERAPAEPKVATRDDDGASAHSESTPSAKKQKTDDTQGVATVISPPLVSPATPSTPTRKRGASDMSASDDDATAASADPGPARRRPKAAVTSSTGPPLLDRHKVQNKLSNKEPLTPEESAFVVQLLQRVPSPPAGGDSYSDDHHNDADHVRWKQQMNDTFAALMQHYAPEGGPVVYLDGHQCRTTQTLQKTGVRWTTYVANTCADNVEPLRRAVDHFVQGDIQTALEQDWHTVPFVGAYLDTCAGSAETIERMVNTLLTPTRYPHPPPTPLVLGYTITSRDPHGQTLIERNDRLQAYIHTQCQAQGWRMVKVDEQYTECAGLPGVYTHKNVITRFVVVRWGC